MITYTKPFDNCIQVSLVSRNCCFITVLQTYMVQFYSRNDVSYYSVFSAQDNRSSNTIVKCEYTAEKSAQITCVNAKNREK